MSAFLKLPALLRDASAALLFPTHCRVCGEPVAHLQDGVACRQCWQATEGERLNFDYCEKCDVSLPRLQRQTQARRCGVCDDLAFTAARACGNHFGAWQESVLRLKIEPTISEYLRQSLIATFWQLPNAREIELIIPIPLHFSRQQERQFNQAEIIANALAQATALPMSVSALVRSKATERHRTGMDSKARQQSLQGAFQVRAPRLIADRTILVVDDVMTTGSTAHEIAQTLREHQARAVSVLTLTRAVTSLSFS